MLVSRIVSALILIPTALIVCIILMFYLDKAIEVTHRRIGPRLRLDIPKKAAVPRGATRRPKAAGTPVAEPIAPTAPD
jgi:hypothetical protein